VGRDAPPTARAPDLAFSDTLPGLRPGLVAEAPRVPAPRAGDPVRRYHRYPLIVAVHLSSAHNFFAAQARNISAGGLFVATDAPLPVGERVEVQFTLPGLEQVYAARCTVRWLRRASGLGGSPPGMGLSFEELAPEVAAAVEAFLAHREPIAVTR
jgi:uncharacterized protein (TIGR02266 family)